MRWIRYCLAAVLLLQQPAWAAKNVILMIADGGGHNQWLAASMYQGKVGKQAYDAPGWVRYAATTYPLNLSNTPTGDEKQDESLVYRPEKAWPVATTESLPDFFRLFLTRTPTDSAAAATALATGRKTYNNAINWSNLNQPMRGQTIAEIAKAQGKAAGVVTTVPWSHATPAGLGGAHNVSRNHYVEIANEMLAAPYLDVIMGAGNPDFDDDGKARTNQPENRDYNYVGGRAAWEQLKAGKHPAGCTLIESKADFDALADVPKANQRANKLLGTVQVATTLQQNRHRGPAPAAGKSVLDKAPFQSPKNGNVPTLATMTKAAVNCLSSNPKGFYLTIEGGAVDWANHANDGGRMIEEQIGFLQAVEAVVEWVNANSSWDDTLLILTADHESGLLWGPSDIFDPIKDNGPGKMPGMKYNSRGHSNSLVPIYARGPGSRRFAELVRGEDRNGVTAWRLSGERTIPDPDDVPRSHVISSPRVTLFPTGKYVDNTDIFTVMRAEVAKHE